MSLNEPLWSTWLNFSVHTLPAGNIKTDYKIDKDGFVSVPQPPKSSISAFSVINFSNSSSLVTFHWRKQPEDEKNGPNFRYVIDKSEETKKIYAQKFLPEPKDIVFSISTVNDIGYSDSEFYITVPRGDVLQELPEVEQSILVDNYGKFLLLWNFSGKLQDDAIVTIFWCSQSSSSQCENGVEWKEVTGAQTSFEIPEEEGFINYAFTSISQNNLTKGMKMVPCRLSLGNFQT